MTGIYTVPVAGGDEQSVAVGSENFEPAWSPDGSRIAFTYIPTGADGRPEAGPWTGLMLWLQKVVGEPWTWSIRPEELDLFLEKLGWTSAPALVETTRTYGVEFYAVATK